MKSVGFLLLLIAVTVAVGAYSLERRGLLTRDSLDLAIASVAGEAKPKSEAPAPPPEPVGLAASVQKKEEEFKKEAEKSEELTKRLESQRRELAAERALLERQLGTMAGKTEPGSHAGSEDAEIVKLVKIYEGMPPEEAASILQKLPDSTVAQILLRMRARQATQVMASLNPDKGASISKLLISGKAGSSL